MATKRKKSNDRGVIKGTQLNYNAGDIAWYREQLKRLVDKMTTSTRKELIRLFEGRTADEFFTTDASMTSQSRIMLAALMKRFEFLFGSKAKDIAEKLARKSNQTSVANIKYSLKDAAKELTINSKDLPQAVQETLKASIQENVALIKSIPSQYFNDVQGSVYRSITSGNGLEQLVPEIKKYEGITNRRASFIAIDQTRKVYASLNEKRMRELDLPGFEFVHSGGGQHPRQTHVAMSGKFYRFSDLPWINADNPNEAKRYGMPGTEPNCRCTARPVVILPGDAPIKWEIVRG